MTNPFPSVMIDDLLDQLDGSGSDGEWDAIRQLREKLGDRLPDYLLLRYRGAKKWQIRSSCVYHSVKYARTSNSAIDIGLLAVTDRSQVVRYRGCMLLAYSLRKELLPQLQVLLDAANEETRADVLAAIDAIEEQNPNYFVDRDHSGMLTLNIQ